MNDSKSKSSNSDLGKLVIIKGILKKIKKLILMVMKIMLYLIFK